MKTKLALAGIIILGFLLRFVHLLTPEVDSDQAVFGLMARHILEGEFPLIQWGFPYMASGESFFAVPFFVFFGATPFSLDLSIAVQSLILILLIFFLGRRIWNSQVGLLAALYISIGPVYLLWHCVLARGAYMETLILGTLTLWMALRILYPKHKSDRRWDTYFLLGLFFGVGLWFHFLIIFFVVPIGLVFLAKPKVLFRKDFFFLILGFLIGSTPFWIHNFTHEFESIQYVLRHQGKHESFFESLWSCLSIGLPVILGILKDGAKVSSFPGSFVFLGCYVFFIGYGLWKCLFSEKHRTGEGNGLGLLLLFFFFYLVIIARSQFVEFDTRRYFVPIFSGISLLWAYPTYRLLRKSRILGIGLVALFISFHLYTNYLGATVMHPTELKIYRDKRQEEHNLIQFLKENHFRHVQYRDYWLGFRLNFIAEEDITFSETKYERYLPYARALEGVDQPVFLERDRREFDLTLKEIGGHCQVKQIGSFALGYDFQAPERQYRQVDTDTIKIETSHESQDVGHMLDRTSGTIWNSGEPKSEGMWTKLDLGKERQLGMVRLWNHPWHYRNYPMKLMIEASSDGVHWTKVGGKAQGNYFYWSGSRIYDWEWAYRWEARFGPIQARFLRMKLLEKSDYDSWMINELFLYEDLGEAIPPLEGVSQIVESVMSLGLERVYADRWMNAKLDQASDGRIKVLEPFTHQVYYGSPPDRRVVWGSKVGFVLEDSDRGAFQEILDRENIQLQRKDFGRWTLFYLDGWGLKEARLLENPEWDWMGLGMVKARPKTSSEYYRKFGDASRKNGHIEEAIRYYRKALERYENHQSLRGDLIQLLKELGRFEEARREGEILKTQTIPQHPCLIKFGKGVYFLGYTLDREGARPGDVVKVTYYWKVVQKLGESLGVFVHVEKGHVLFQGDHSFLENYGGEAWFSFENEVLRQSKKLKIPHNVSSGEYAIKLGLFDPATGDRWKVHKTDAKHEDGRVSIGVLRIEDKV